MTAQPPTAADRPGPPAPATLRAQVFLTLGERVVVANHRGQPWFFLLGEQVAPGESVEQVLHRVLRRTAGFEVRALDFVGGLERVADGDNASHEIDLVFAGTMPRFAQFGSRVDDVDLVTVQMSELRRMRFRPPQVGVVIQEWLRGREPRWHTDGGSSHPPTVSTA